MEASQLNWIANFIWGIADDVLRDLYVRGKYRGVILPMTVLRRLDVLLEPTKQAVLEMKAALDRKKIVHQDRACVRRPAGACGTGGMLTVAEETLQELAAAHGKQVATHLYGQEINAETSAICKADLLLKGEGEAADNIVGGPEHSTLSSDAFPSRQFDFMLSNPPYGKSWKSDQERMGGKKDIQDPRFLIEHAGDPEYSLVTRSSDGQMLFLANMLSKMKVGTRLGSRIAEVHNGSSLFTGDAGQGESNIRRWILENDWLEAIVALPLNMFYNTGIATYVWVLTNRKPRKRKGKVQLIDATAWFKPLRKNLGKKNCELSPEDIRRICKTFLAFKESEQSKIFPNAAFGYWKVTVERPLRVAGTDPERVYSPREVKALKDGAERSEAAPPVIRKVHRKGTDPAPLLGLFATRIDGRPAVVEYEPDPDLRDTEQVPLLEEGSIEAFLRREVLPHAPDAWYIPDSVKTGYEISFTRYFYKPQPLRTLEEIRADILGEGDGRVVGRDPREALQEMNADRGVEVYRRRSIRLAGYDYAQPGAYFVTVCTQEGACLFGEIRDSEMHVNAAGEMLAAVWSSLPRRFPKVALDAFVVMPNHVHGVLFLGHPRVSDPAAWPLVGTNVITEPVGAPLVGAPLADTTDIFTAPGATTRVAPTTDPESLVPTEAIPVGAPLVGARPPRIADNVTEPPIPVGAPLVGARPGRITDIATEPPVPPLVGTRAPGITDIATEPGATTWVAPTSDPEGSTPTIIPTLGDVVAAFKSLTTVEFVRGVKTSGWPPFSGRLWQRNYYEHIIRDDASLKRVRQYIAENPARWVDDSEHPARRTAETVRR